MTRPLRLGIVTSGATMPAWQLAALRGLLAEDGVVPALVIDCASSSLAAATGTGTRDDAADTPPVPLPADPLRPVTAAAELRGVPRLAVTGGTPASESGSHALDLIWSTIDGAPPTGLAELAPLGLWALVVENGDPACGDALLRARPTIVARLLRLGPRPDRAALLEEGHFRNEPFAPSLTRARVLHGCAVWPARRLRAWRLQGAAALAGEDIALTAPVRLGPITRLALPIRQLVSLATRALANCYADKWAIAISERPIAAFLDGPDPTPRWLAEAPGRDFHADPFGIETPDGPVLLAEAFDDGRGFGRIDVLRPGGADGSGSDPVAARDVMPPACHLSYPYLVEDGGQVFCVPETHQERRIALWRGDPFPARWVREAVLVDDFAGVDATVFFHDGRWWMLCGCEDDERDGKLYGFFAEDLRGPWVPHPLNPLACDPRSTRPGGTPFVHRGVLHRPAQDCSATYGGAIVINRVETLSPIAFAEAPVARIEPDAAGPYPAGIHTLAAVGGRTVMDGKRFVFAPGQLLRAARHFLGRLRRHRSAGLQPRMESRS